MTDQRRFSLYPEVRFVTDTQIETFIMLRIGDDVYERKVGTFEVETLETYDAAVAKMTTFGMTEVAAIGTADDYDRAVAYAAQFYVLTGSYGKAIHD